MTAGIFVYVLICISSCDNIINKHYSDRVFYVKEDCEKTAKNVAINMYLTTKAKYGYKCIIPDYIPPKIN